MKTVLVLTVVGLAATANADITPMSNIADLSQANGQGTIYSDFSGLQSVIAGDSFTAEPLVQDGISAFFTDDNTASIFAEGVEGFGGVNIAGAAGSTSNALAGSVPLGGGMFVGFASVHMRDAAGALGIWVDAANAGAGFTTWRADVGTIAGGTDGLGIDLAPGESFSVLSAAFVAFNSTGGSLGTFALSVDNSDAAQLAGLAVIGLGGADIAGFDLAGIEMQWTYEIVPAPASAALLGLGGFAAIRRRR